jgi:hypothetical protein
VVSISYCVPIARSAVALVGAGTRLAPGQGICTQHDMASADLVLQESSIGTRTQKGVSSAVFGKRTCQRSSTGPLVSAADWLLIYVYNQSAVYCSKQDVVSIRLDRYRVLLLQV